MDSPPLLSPLLPPSPPPPIPGKGTANPIPPLKFHVMSVGMTGQDGRSNQTYIETNHMLTLARACLSRKSCVGEVDPEATQFLAQLDSS